MDKFAYAEKALLFKQGSVGHNIFIVVSGRVEILVNNKTVKTSGVGEILGERALMGTNKRSASVLTLRPVKCWVLNGDHFQGILKQLNEERK